MHYLSLLIFFFLIPQGVIAQEFSGVLKYRLIHKISESRRDMYRQFGVDRDTVNYATATVTIYKDTLVVNEMDDSDFDEVWTFQEGENIYIDFTTSKIPYGTLFPNGINYKFIKKGDKTKTILNTLCFQYFYVWGDNMEIVAWIPKGYKYPVSHSYGDFFNRYFFDEGLVYRDDIMRTSTNGMYFGKLDQKMYLKRFVYCKKNIKR